VTRYYEYPVDTSIARYFEDKPEFPAITICGFNTTDFECQFNRVSCNHIKPDNDEEFCFTFNSKKKNWQNDSTQIFKSKEPGFENGLKLKLKVRSDLQDLSINALNRSVIYIHNRSEEYDLYNAIKLPNDVESSLILGRQFVKKLSYPYNDCQSEYSFQPLDMVNSSFYFPYFKADCLNLCKYQAILESCNKSQDYIDIYRYYFTNNQYFFAKLNSLSGGCLKNYSSAIDITTKTPLALKLLRCLNNCPDECNSVLYTTAYIYNGNTLGYTTVNIYYEDFSYILNSETPKITFYNLLGSIGGLFGLFLGCSFVSLIEILELTILAYHFIVDTKKNQQNLRLKEIDEFETNNIQSCVI